MTDARVIEQLAESIGRLIPEGLTAELREALRATLRARLDQLGLVTREELEVQEAVLARLQQQVRELEKQIEAYEKEKA